MSKNFELMQQAGKEQALRPSSMPEPVSKVTFGNGHGNGNRKTPPEADGLDLDMLAGEEALRLVQRVFLLQAQEPPHMVVFAGIDHGNGCSRICVQCGGDSREEYSRIGLLGRGESALARAARNVWHHESSRT